MTAIIPNLSTARLSLTVLQMSDAPAIQAKFPHWEIVRFMADVIPWPYPDNGAERYIQDVALPAMQDNREWHWAIRPKADSSELIGVISLADREDDHRGFWLDPAWQNQGLMAEACECVTNFWFHDLQRSVLRTTKAIGNHRSRRVSERMQMRMIATSYRNYVAGRLLSEIWEITREEWLERHR